MAREICIELVRFGKVDSYEVVSPEEARKILETKMVAGNRYRISPPDKTGELPDDEARYAADCEACGVSNPFAYEHGAAGIPTA